MPRLINWLRRQRWAAFLVFQCFLFGIAIIFLTGVRYVTGRSIHLGRDPIGMIDGILIGILSIGVILLTRSFYERVRSKDGPDLGLAPSRRRALQFLAGIGLGITFFAAPWLISIELGSASITDTITANFDTVSAALIIGPAWLLLLLQAVMEETANRAFPIQLWYDRSLLFRIVVPAAFFVLIHLVSESFSMERTALLFIAGLVQGFAFMLTGNIWLTSGLHFGANVASFSLSGVWHAGALVAIQGESAVSIIGASLVPLVALAALYVVKTYRLSEHSVASDPDLPVPDRIDRENEHPDMAG
ncbi:MAG TPA: CPBP family intramembrane glutamic endopeptidase [Pyrinomonadaceae bacterium]